MGRYGLLSICVLWMLSIASLNAQDQDEVCDPATQTPFPDEEKVDVSTLLPLATLNVPESCGAFQFPDLIGCAKDLNIKKGCCDASCKAVFAKVPHACVQDLAEELCSMDDFADFVQTLNHLAKRCDDDFKKVTCKNTGKSPPSTATEEPETALPASSDKSNGASGDDGTLSASPSEKPGVTSESESSDEAPSPTRRNSNPDAGTSSRSNGTVTVSSEGGTDEKDSAPAVTSVGTIVAGTMILAVILA